MRRKEREIKEITEIEEIIRRSKVCRLSMAVDNQPYIVPMNFGYQNRTLYFHSALRGKKIDMIQKNNRVCFEFDLDHQIKETFDACDWGMKYKSVVGFGLASFVTEYHRKCQALDIIMHQYSLRSFKYKEKAVKIISIIKVEITGMTGKMA